MTEHQTALLSERLHRLADDMTPQLDVVTHVRTARARHRRHRRTRLALLAAATAAAAVVVGTTTTAVLLSVDRGTEVAVPGTPTATPDVPAGWEPREFRGVTFAVPPGARTADTVDQPAKTSWTAGPTLTWDGPEIGGGYFSYVQVSLRETYQGGLTPLDGGERFEVAGAEKAYGRIRQNSYPSGDNTYDTTQLWLYVLVGDRQVAVRAEFAAGPEGEQTAQQLIDSLSVAGLARDGGFDEDGARGEQWDSQLEQDEAARAQFAPGIERMSATFAALRDPISLSAPGDASCPIGLDGALSGAADACALPTHPSPPASEMRGTIRFHPGETIDDLRLDVNRESGGCYSAAMPNPGPMAVLLACETGEGTEWTLRILADDESGVWELRAAAVEAPEDRAGTAGPSMLSSLMELADGKW